MSTEWLTAQSFQRAQELLAAINLLSIHIKLRSRRLTTGTEVEETQRAREAIIRTLRELEEAATRSASGPMVGLDARQRMLAAAITRTSKVRRATSLPDSSTEAASMARLIEQDDPNNDMLLVSYLGELRRIIERHLQDDATRILGTL